jgi:hypothetical protein
MIVCIDELCVACVRVCVCACVRDVSVCVMSVRVFDRYPFVLLYNRT